MYQANANRKILEDEFLIPFSSFIFHVGGRKILTYLRMCICPIY